MIKEKNFLAILALILSFFSVIVLEKNVFLGATPKIRPNWAKKFFNKIYLAYSIFFKNNRLRATVPITPTLENKETNVFLKMITKGIYAETKDNQMEIIVKISEVDWVEYELKDKRIKIRLPKNQTLPKEVVGDF
jgi:hypothetical protein